jgi:hypothetical protein
MDLQEIKKEIESLRKDTTSFSTHQTSKKASSFMGFSYLRVIVTAVTSGLLIYLFKPVYMYNFSVDNKEGEDKLKVKKSISYTKAFLSFLVCFAILLALQKLPISLI